jgi:hypothetical protein
MSEKVSVFLFIFICYYTAHFIPFTLSHLSSPSSSTLSFPSPITASLLNCLLRPGDKSVKSKKVPKTISTDGIDISTYTFRCPVNDNGKPDANGANSAIVRYVVLVFLSLIYIYFFKLKKNFSSSFLLSHHPSPIFSSFSLSAWDFGGQEIYYSTHQFFLSHRSVYVVVWNIALDEEFSRVEFWLQSILARARGMRNE